MLTAVAEGTVFIGVCLFVFLHDISKADAAGITKLDTQMFHDKSWKPIYPFIFGSKDQRSRSPGTKNSLSPSPDGMQYCRLLRT